MSSGTSQRIGTRLRVFTYERELRDAVRQALTQLEPGLAAADDGKERVVSTGKIDITARDANGHFVVIELKAGPCPSGALEQVLGYATDLEQETGTPCRAVLVASTFSKRIQAAALRARDISLVTYEVGDVIIQPQGAM